MTAGPFPSTRRSLLLSVSSPELRDEALAAVAEIYWKPAYKYIRLKWRKSEDEARDRTQDFFAGLLERELVQRWDPARAGFRTYLRMCIDASVKNDLTSQARAKRKAPVESLDFAGAEAELAAVSPDGDPETIFHREWQRRMFELAVADLRADCRENDKSVRFAVFERHDLAPEPPSYNELATVFSIPVTTITNHLAWARREIRRRVLERLSQTTAGGDEARREARELFR